MIGGDEDGFECQDGHCGIAMWRHAMLHDGVTAWPLLDGGGAGR